jgi:hypothetical protein
VARAAPPNCNISLRDEFTATSPIIWKRNKTLWRA